MGYSGLDGWEATMKWTHSISSKTSGLGKRNKACTQLPIILVGKGEVCLSLFVAGRTGTGAF